MASTAPSEGARLPLAAGPIIKAQDGLGGICLVTITNVTALLNIGIQLNPREIALRCRNTEFSPKRRGVVVMRIREGRLSASATIFKSGKMLLTGMKSANDSILAAKKIVYAVGKAGFAPTGNIEFKITNIMGTADVGFHVRLEGLQYALAEFGETKYDPELSTALRYDMVSPHVVSRIFPSGKVLMSGAKTELELSDSLACLYRILVEHKAASRIAPREQTNGYVLS